MLRAFRNIRAGEGRDTWTGFVCLLVMIGSHSILETARDALFLASIPAARLPWMYIAIAVLSLMVTQLQQRASSSMAGRSALSLWAFLAAVVTGGFWLALPLLGEAGLYALYVWSGVLTTLVLVHFWTLLGDLFSVTQAKRLYGLIGAGSVIGAIIGSGLAGALARSYDGRHLVLAAALGFGLAALLPMLFSNRGDLGGAGKSEATPSIADNLAFVARSPYAGRIALLLVVAAVALTFGDFLFKQTVAASVPQAELGTYFASIYLVLNSVSLLAQLLLVSWVLRRFDLSTALSILPFLLMAGAGAMLAVPGLVAAIAIKGPDGALRHSLHRTATELLFVPLSEGARRRVKAFIDVIGQRGGQALASGVILGLVAVGAPGRWVAVLLGFSAALWLGLAIALRRHYLDLFRGRLRSLGHYHQQFPDLDVASLENLIAALDSQNDDEVLAALEVLEREDKVRLVPGLILYHPSEAVVIAALDLFARVRRPGVIEIVDRLLDHNSPRIRAAAIASRSVLDPNERMLRRRLTSEESADVRATIMINLIAGGEIVGSDAKSAIDAVLRHGKAEAKIALAEAIARRKAAPLCPVLVSLASELDIEVRRAAVRAMGVMGDSQLVPTLVDLLADERLRAQVRRTLQHLGDDAFQALSEALADQALPRGVRWQLPRALTYFDPQPAADTLLSHLPDERDGMVRYRSIRALQRLVTGSPDVALEKRTLDAAILNTVERSYRYLDRELTLRRGVDAEPERKRPGFELLAKMLADKRQHCVDRLLRLLGLRYPREDFSLISRALSGNSRVERESGVELVENALSQPLRDAVVGLIDEMPDGERLHLGRHYHQPLGLDYEGLLRHMLDSSSVSVQDLTAFHLGELRLAESFGERLNEIRSERRSSDIDRALELSLQGR
ncbi:MAG: HEAT repeat domain-containing protein [Deltaproteobacteria bacterium]|nr:HEAT repeat domain-containing protein [Deltaproteobacteria bacterium]